MSGTFKNFIMFKARIPFEFKMNNNDYLLTTNVKIDKNLKGKRRRFIFHRENVFLEKQLVPSTNSNFVEMNFPNTTFSYFISKIEIQLEIFEDEINEISEYYSNRENGINMLSSIFQNVLLIFAHLYNETMGGEDFFRPIADYYGPFVSSLYLEKNTKEERPAILSSSYTLSKKKNDKILDLEKIFPIQWRYYFNRSKNAYNLYDNTDVILSGAISMESYVIWLINKNGLREEFKEYKNKNSSISFFQEVSFLKKNKAIDNDKARKLCKTFSIFKDYKEREYKKVDN